MRFPKGRFFQLCFLVPLISALELAAPVASAASASPTGAVGAANETAECHGRSIVGAWTATVYRDDGTVERNDQLSFTSDGKAVTQGVGIGEGDGTWVSEGDRRFSYTTRTNMDWGYLIVSAEIVLRGDAFVGVGGGTAYDAQGNVLGASRSRIVATRAEGAEVE